MDTAENGDGDSGDNSDKHWDEYCAVTRIENESGDEWIC